MKKDAAAPLAASKPADAGKANGGPGPGPGSPPVNLPAPGASPAVSPSPAPAAALLTDHDVLKYVDNNPATPRPTGAAQLALICARPGQDRVRQTFCTNGQPNLAAMQGINSLVALQTAIGLANGGFAFTSHSTSLVMRSVSAINPRLVLFTPGNVNANTPYTSMGFVRGDQFAEIIARDTSVANNLPGNLKFFIVKFEQACNSAPGGCTNADLLSARIESNWTGVSIYEDEDLKNTVLDCRQCHQPGGPNTAKILRMQELQNPWIHWLRNNANGGSNQLIADFERAFPPGAAGLDARFAGIPMANIRQSNPPDLEDFVTDAGFGNQPNEFDTLNANNTNVNTNGRNAGWLALFQQNIDGLSIQVPYHSVRVTDPTKLTAAVNAITAFRANPAVGLPDIREVYPDNAATLGEMGFTAAPTLTTGAQIITQTCTQCHNPTLDQNIGRARFNVANMTPASRVAAINRIMREANDLRIMPPKLFRTLTPAQKQLVVTELCQGVPEPRPAACTP